MMAVSDGVVIGIVLGLVFAAVSYYLYTRMSQLEKKVGYMEGILLDLKVTTEQAILSATEPHDHGPLVGHEQPVFSPSEEAHDSKHLDDAQGAEQPSRIRTPVATPTPASSPVHATEVSEQPQSSASSSMSVNYESMTYKELQQLARQRNISGLRNLSKAQVIEIIRAHDNGTTPPSSSSVAPMSLSAWKADEGTQGTSIEHLTSMDEVGNANAPAPIQSASDDHVDASFVASE